MAGLKVFRSISEALREGYAVYDRTRDGYLVRMRTARGWAMAIVELQHHDLPNPDFDVLLRGADPEC